MHATIARCACDQYFLPHCVHFIQTYRSAVFFQCVDHDRGDSNRAPWPAWLPVCANSAVPRPGRWLLRQRLQGHARRAALRSETPPRHLLRHARPRGRQLHRPFRAGVPVPQQPETPVHRAVPGPRPRAAQPPTHSVARTDG